MSPASRPSLAFSYIRFSHPDQAKGDSLRRQVEAAAAWCGRNHVTLDTSLTLHDLGKSAYTGEHRKNPDRHALAAFLKLIESGKVPQGSCLLIENLDRLSREHEVPACHLLTGILMAGVSVVQLAPYEMVLTDKSNGWELMRAVMELSRGHGESALKSDRVGKAWARRRQQTRENGAILTHKLPLWVEAKNGKLRLIPERAAAVRRVFALSAAGYGNAGIVKKLTAEKVPAFGEAGHWSRTYVDLILKDRRALGELQPRTRDGKPDGEPIPKYYPPVVTEAEWQAARSGSAQRRKRMGRGRRWTPEEDAVIRALSVPEAAKKLGRTQAAVRVHKCLLSRRDNPPAKKDPTAQHVNVFSGLLKDALDGNSYYVATRSSKFYGTRWRVLLNVASAEGRAPARSFPFGVFEQAVLSLLREIDPHDILNGDSGPDLLQTLSGRRAEVENKIAQLEAELLDGDIPAVARVLKRLEDEKRELVEREAEARQKATRPLSAAWGEARSLIGALAKAPDPADARTRLRAVLKRMVDSVWLVTVPRGRDRLCAAQVWFAGGKRHREYLIYHRPASVNFARAQKGGWWAKSLSQVISDGYLDLRDRAHARKLEQVLQDVDVAALQR
jgi:DNA invertase Pin-like site-specific DNA recombinase